MNNYKYNIFLLFFLLIFTQNIALSNSVDTIQVNKNTTKLNLFNYIEIFEDVDNNLNIEDIATLKYKDSFKPASVVGNTFGFSDSSFWVRFSMNIDKNIVDSLYLELAYPLMDYATIYIPKADGEFIEKKSGELINSSLKSVNYRNHLFIIPKTTDKTYTYYMKVNTVGSIQIPLYIFTPSAFIEEVDKSNFIFGGYYGNMILMMLATFVAFLKIRDTIFLTYAVYLFSYLFFQLSMNGFFSHFLLPLPLEYANITTHISLVLVVLGGALFSGQYLQIWSGKYPKIRLLYYLIMLNSLLGFFIAPTINYALGVQISVVSGLLLPPIVLLGAIYSLYSGYTPAKYFLAAWSVFLFGIFMSGLVFLGLIPHTFVTAHSMQLGSTLELLLLSYALIERVNTLHKDKEIATENANKYLNQINEGLESLVAERTQELEEKNKLLGELAIRDSMTGMLNHNASIEKLSSMKSAALRYGYNLAVVMIDIDFFKSINDKYGHPAGDKVIIEIASIIKHTIRQSDSAGRYGGEEFILLLHDTDRESATDLSERIKASIESSKIAEINNDKISASFGIGIFDSYFQDADIIKHADNALYEAKESGRNRVVIYTS